MKRLWMASLGGILLAGCGGEEAIPQREEFFGTWKKAGAEPGRETTIELRSPDRFTMITFNSPDLGGQFRTNEDHINFIFREPKEFVKRETKMRGGEVWELPMGYRFEDDDLILIPLNGGPEDRMVKQ